MKTKNPAKIKKILIVTLSNLGDVVMTLPVFGLVREACPSASVDVIVGSGGRDVFEGDERLRRVILYDKKATLSQKWEMLREIRAQKYDLILDLRRSLFGLLGGARYRNSYFSILPGKRSHRVLRHLYVLKKLLPIHHTRSYLWERATGEGSELFPFIRQAQDAGQRIILAAPGSKSDIKKWPVEYYAKLLDRLAEEENCRIVLIGDKNDAVDAAKVETLMKSKPENVCGRSNFMELLSIVQKADLVITNDSAPLHIADALRRPVLAIFGPTDPKKYGPRYRNSSVARRLVFCSPCEKAQCRYKHECMKELGVDEVHQKALAILNDTIDRKNLKVLVIRLDRIGDVVLSLPAMQAIRDRFPNASISVVTRPATAPLVEGHPAVNKVLPYFYERGGRHHGILGNFRFIYEIIRHKFDVVFILNPSLRSYLVPFFAGIPYRVGFKRRPGFLLTHSVPDRRSEGAKHEAEYTLDVVRAFGIEAHRADSYTGMLQHCRNPNPSEKNIIALHAGASCPSKRWPREKFAALGRKIREQYPATSIVIIGGREEKELGEYLTREIGGQTENLTDRLSLKELARFLSGCQLLVSNDSGPVHVASAVGTRTLTIFGRSSPGLGVVRWRALGQGHGVIQKDVGCVVCLAHECTIDFECLKAVSVEEVWETFKSMTNTLCHSRASGNQT